MGEPAIDYEELARALIREGLPSQVARALAPHVGPTSATTPRYADKDSNPYGSERAFLDAARAGKFPTFRRCRRITALWADVEKAIEEHGRGRPKRIGADEPLDVDELLAASRPRRRRSPQENR